MFIKFIGTNILIIIGLFVAIQGLNTWKKQIKGNAEYEIARKTLHMIYKIRFGIEQIRQPFMSVYEMKIEGDFTKKNDNEIRAAGIREAYIKRTDLLYETKNKLFVDILEAEVLWGKKIKIICYDLISDVRELELAIEDKIEITNDPNNHNDEYWKDRSKEIKGIISAKSMNSLEINNKDEYAIKIECKIKIIEDYLKPFLNK